MHWESRYAILPTWLHFIVTTLSALPSTVGPLVTWFACPLFKSWKLRFVRVPSPPIRLTGHAHYRSSVKPNFPLLADNICFTWRTGRGKLGSRGPRRNPLYGGLPSAWLPSRMAPPSHAALPMIVLHSKLRVALWFFALSQLQPLYGPEIISN